MNINVLFHAPEYRPNLSNMIRTAEFYGLSTIYIYDKNNLLNPPKNNKVNRAEMNHLARVWTAGAIEFVDIINIEDPENFIENYEGRVIAPMIDKTAQPLAKFKFEKNDLIVMGSEKEGLPETFANKCDFKIYIPQIGNTNCLNVSVTFGIILNQSVLEIQKG